MVQTPATPHLLTQERQCSVVPEAQALKTQTVKDTQEIEGKDKARTHISCSKLSTLETTLP